MLLAVILVCSVLAGWALAIFKAAWVVRISVYTGLVATANLINVLTEVGVKLSWSTYVAGLIYLSGFWLLVVILPAVLSYAVASFCLTRKAARRRSEI